MRQDSFYMNYDSFWRRICIHTHVSFREKKISGGLL